MYSAEDRSLASYFVDFSVKEYKKKQNQNKIWL